MATSAIRDERVQPCKLHAHPRQWRSGFLHGCSRHATGPRRSASTHMNLPLHNTATVRDDAVGSNLPAAPVPPPDPATLEHQLDATELALREHQRHVRDASYAPPTVDFFRVH